MKKNILVLFNFNEKFNEQLEKAYPNANYIYANKTTITDEHYKSAHIIIGNAAPSILKSCENLEWIQITNAGVEPYIAKDVLNSGVILTNATGGYGIAIAEHMIGMVLGLMKKFHKYRDLQKTGEWKDLGNVDSICDAKVLTVGLGDIGSEFAKRVKAFGGYNIAIKTNVSNKPDYVDELYTMDSLDELLPQADIVALCVPNTPLTQNLLSADRLKAMKKGSYLINIARGIVVDTMGLYDVLQSNHLAGAGLDVTNPEPLPQDHPLWQCENVIITPHTSGAFHAEIIYTKILEIVFKNLNSFYNNEKLINVVDFKAGYAKK